MYFASFSVTAHKKSNWWDDAAYRLEYSKLIPTFYPLREPECEKLWDTKKKVKLTDFGNEDITTPWEKVDSILASETTISFKINLSKIVMRKA